MEIIRALLPVIIVGGIAVFVILRMKHKYKNDTLGKKKTKNAQSLLDSFIPLGMLFGSAIGIIFSMFIPISLVSGLSYGAAVGLLIGYVAYEIYSKKGTSHL